MSPRVRDPRQAFRSPVTAALADRHRARAPSTASSSREPAMHPDLEAIVAADEECRSRVALAEQRRARQLADARGERDALIARRTAAARSAFDEELRSIEAEGNARLEQLRRKQADALSKLSAAGER